jgi:DNA-binding XRE family transcriptional regulator
MEKTKRERLESKGWIVGTVADFLELTPEESALVEIRLALSKYLRRRREDLMAQAQLAEKLGASPQQIVSVEVDDGEASLDLLVRALLTSGATPLEIGKAIAGADLAVRAD